ncbi:hypothetical protein FOCG_00211 [Fusarium oxysporum f. sp. radicis-lycopersici 26381]|nr:hypothetical protein FOCG_00211 [Fusarium oxysporum f. sp. radicis-lycopersici 26381]
MGVNGCRAYWWRCDCQLSFNPLAVTVTALSSNGGHRIIAGDFMVGWASGSFVCKVTDGDSIDEWLHTLGANFTCENASHGEIANARVPNNLPKLLRRTTKHHDFSFWRRSHCWV